MNMPIAFPNSIAKILSLFLLIMLFFSLSGSGQEACSGYTKSCMSTGAGIVYTFAQQAGPTPTVYLFDFASYTDARDFLCDDMTATCAPNMVGDVYQDGYDYIVIPENVRLTMNDHFILTDAAVFPRPIIFLIVGVNDATGGQLHFGNNAATFIYLPGPFSGNKNSDIRMVANLTDNPFTPVTTRTAAIDGASGNKALIVIDQDNDYDEDAPPVIAPNQSYFIGIGDDDPGNDIVFIASSGGGNDKHYTIADIETNGGIQAFITLPIELAFFQARPERTGVRLTWQTVWEQDNDYFEVQHSKDGANFYVLDKMKGRGTTELRNNYDYLHEKPFPGVNYYRLRQVDFDGAFSYSPVVAIDMRKDGGAPDFILAPNPAARRVNLFGAKPSLEKPRVFLSNALGQVFPLSAIETGDGYELDLPAALPAGVYQLHLVWAQERVVKALAVR